MTKKMIVALMLTTFGMLISIAQTDVAIAANLTTDADNVESLVEITDIIEKEMLNSTDYTKFDIFDTVGDSNFLWSPDGSKLLILAHRNMATKGDPKRVPCGEFGLHERVSTLFWMHADGSEVTNIARAEESIRAAKNNTAAFIDSAWWSSSGDKIVFLVLNPCAENPHNLYVSDRNGSILAEAKGFDYPLIQWNPDRNKIAILDRPPNNTLIYAIDVKNSTVKQLPLSAAGYQNDIKYSPDGEKIAFIGNKDGNVYTVDVDNSFIQQLTTDMEVRGLTWKPDGKKLVFVAVDGLYVMDADGSNLKLIEKENFSLGLWGIGSWSPDGKKLLFITISDIENRNYKLKVFDIDSGTAKLIDAKWVSYITWSPDSDRIAFISEESKRIYIVNSDGTNKITLPENYFAEREGAYGWVFDNKIYYLTKDSLVKVNPDGIEQPIVKNIPTNIYSSNEMSLSPDGSRILLTIGNMLKRERNSNSYILKLKGYDDVMSIYAPGSIKQGDSALIEVKSMSKPVENAVVSLNGREIGATNETGFLKYSFREAGNYKLSAAKQGFRSASKSITIQESPSEQSSPEPTFTATPQITKPATTAATLTPKAPGFDAALAIGILSTIHLFKRRYN